MASEVEDPRALDFCAVGLGQGGGNLAAEWRRRGYRAVLLNTARSDLRGLSRQADLEIPEKYRIHIGIGTTDGAGKDPDYGAVCLRQHADLVKASIEENLDGADGLLICAGLGGGTGSAISALLEILEPLELPAIAVVTIPSHAESGIAKVNAVKTANALITAPLHGRVFIDNERLVESFPDVDIISYYPTVNAQVLAPLDALNRLNARQDLFSIRSFDGEDMRKVVLSGGVLQTHIERLDDTRTPSAQDLVKAVAHCVNGGKHLAPGLTLEDCAYLAVVVVGPERILRKTPIQVFDETISVLKEKTKGGAIYEGLYVGKDDTPLEVYVLSASLALPERVKDLLGDAQTEGQDLMRKINEEIPEMEISPLEGLDLFRAPARRRGAVAKARPQAPKPRPLSEQLRATTPAPQPGPKMPVGVEQRPLRASPEESTGIFREESLRGSGKSDVGSVLPSPVAMVGTGRYDDDDAGKLEPTMQVSKDAADAFIARYDAEATEQAPRRGSGRNDSDVIARALTEPPAEPTEFVHRSSVDGPPPAAPDEVSLPEGLSVEDRAIPRVGTGRISDDEGVEPTEYRHDLRSIPATDADQQPVAEPSRRDVPVVDEARRDNARESGSRAQNVRVGTGRVDDDPRIDAPEETVPAPRAKGELIPGENGLFNPADLPFDYDIAGEAPGFELPAALTRPVDEDAILAASDIYDDIEPDTLASLRRPTVVSNMDDMLLSSIVGDPHENGTGLQNVYEDLIDRFRQAGDRRGRERVARRLIDDSRADDVEVRALAVWAMVKLEEKGFRRALAKSANDDNPEIAKLAISGLERIEEKGRVVD